MILVSDLTGFVQNDKNAPEWYLNYINSDVDTADAISLCLGISQDEFLQNCYYYNYIRLPYVDIYEIQQKYLAELNDKRLSKRLNRLSKDDFVREFTEIFEYELDESIEGGRWIDFKNKCNALAIISWCRENKLPYMDDTTAETG